jgi:hypothetical protein
MANLFTQLRNNRCAIFENGGVIMAHFAEINENNEVALV